jgi:hypothetical protein
MSSTEQLSRAGIVRLAACCLCALILVNVAGCESSNPLSGQTLYPVKGKVLLRDGKPLTSGRVIFVATKSTITSTADVGSDGGFTFKGASGDGLPEGEYKIRIDAGSSGTATKGLSRGEPQGNLPFDSMFLDEDSSGLTATVTSDESKNNFELKLVPTASATQAKKGTADSRGGR